jgi:hypothetical protein
MAFTGKGICFIDNQKFEGNFIDGKLNGIGIQYFSNHENKKKYEGDFYENLLNGKGIQYDLNEKKICEGEFHMGKFVKGIKYYENGNKYKEGEFKNNDFIKGIQYYENGNKQCDGEFLNGELIKGIVYYENEVYILKQEHIKPEMKEEIKSEPIIDLINTEPVSFDNNKSQIDDLRNALNNLQKYTPFPTLDEFCRLTKFPNRETILKRKQNRLETLYELKAHVEAEIKCLELSFL